MRLEEAIRLVGTIKRGIRTRWVPFSRIDLLPSSGPSARLLLFASPPGGQHRARADWRAASVQVQAKQGGCRTKCRSLKREGRDETQQSRGGGPTLPGQPADPAGSAALPGLKDAERCLKARRQRRL